MRHFPGILAVAFILAWGGMSAARAAPQLTPLEKDYLATRDATIAKLKARVDASGKIDDATSANDAKALADLETRLRAIVGAVNVAGFGAANAVANVATKSNLETLLAGDLGFGTLDALTVKSADGKVSVLVTTEPLLSAWLRGHRRWWGRRFPGMPQDIAAALRTEAFYTQATTSGAAMVQYGALPVRKPEAAALAFAVLASRTQDQSPPAPDQMFVTLLMRGKVFIANAPLAQAIAPDPSCASLRAAFEQRTQAAFEAYRASGLRDKKQFDRSTALRDEGDRAERRCFAEKMTGDARAQVAKQAQGFVELMAQ